MNIHNEIEPIGTKTAVALGYFDGIHRGHRDIIERTIELSRKLSLCPSVFTFDFSTNRPGGKGAKDLISFERKSMIFEELGIRECCHIDFAELMPMDGAQFVEQVLSHGCLNAAVVCCGKGFRLGKGRECDVKLLRKLCSPYGIQVFDFAETDDKGTISTTRIKRALEQGDMKQVIELLGRPYLCDLPIAETHEFSPGFSDSNEKTIRLVQYSDPMLVCPKPGVYSSRVTAGEEQFRAVTLVFPFKNDFRLETLALDAPLDATHEVSLLSTLSLNEPPADESAREQLAASLVASQRIKV